MILTKKTIMTWESPEAKISPAELYIERAAVLETAVTAGKTDGEPNNTSDTTTERYWTDLAAATEWAEWIQAAATRFSAGLISVTIEDL